MASLRFAPNAAGHGAETAMSESDSDTDTDERSDDETGAINVIFVDGTGDDAKQTHEADIVDAVTIIENAGYDESPSEYILEALEGQGGDVDEQFDPQGEVGPREVDLTEQHRTHFRVTTRGEVFI